MENLFPSIVRNSLFSTCGRLSIKAISFVFTIFIIRWFGDEDYGRYLLIWSYITIFAMFSDAGLSMYAIREIAKKTATSPTIIGNIILIRLILATLTIAVLLGIAWSIGYNAQFLWQIFLASTILFLYAVQDPLDAILQAHERFDLATFALVTGQLIFVCLGVVLLALEWHIVGLIIAALANVVGSAILAGQFILTRYRDSLSWRLEPARWPSFIRASVPFGFIKLWLSWSAKIGIVILSWFWAEKMVGWYGAAYAIVLGFVSVSNAVNVTLYPALSRQYTETPGRMPKFYESVLKYLLLFALPVAGAISVTAERWVTLLYGPDFSASATVLALLIWVVPLSFVSEFFRYILLATDRDRAAVRALGVMVLAAIGLNLGLIPIYGLTAAAAITVFAEILLLLLYIRQLEADLSPINLLNSVFKPALATTTMMSVLILVAPAEIIWQVMVGGISYLAAIWLLRIIDRKEFRLLLRMIRPSRSRSTATRTSASPVPLVSVFIPAYNAAPFLAKAIDTVLNQTYQNFELIVIDDGSTDHTAEVLRNYEAHPKVTIHRHPRNRGMAATWNEGLTLCRGDFIAKLDADDFYEAGYLQAVVEFFQKHRGLGLVFSGLNLIYPDGRTEPEMAFLNSWVRGHRAFLASLLRLCSIRSPTVCVRRSCYEQLGGFNEAMKIHADWEMWVRIAATHPVGFIARRLANYRMSYGLNCTAQAAVDGRSMTDLRLWLEQITRDELPYRLTNRELNQFKAGIYELEMHFAGVAAYHHRPDIQQAYIAFAEQIFPHNLPPQELARKRQVYLDLHQGICAFQERQLSDARRYFLRAIRTGPGYCKPLWIWSKLLLTFVGRTKWGVMYR
ncbi:MAG: glycosyltransferase [Anaerolineae bacterium]|nr:glycosyltransferase [Anaerolineae bacterium]